MGRQRHVRGWVAAFLVGALAIAAVAGCGKSKPTKATFTARANAVCSAENKSLKRLTETRHTTAELIRESFRIRERANAQLRRIPVPDKDKLPAGWLHVRETAIAEARKIFANKPHSPASEAANKAFNRLEGEAIKFADSYGVRECLAFATT